MNRAAKIIALANVYRGKIEKPGNLGFFDHTFERDMKAVGWYVRAPWCMFLVNLVWQYAYADHAGMLKTVKRTFTGGALDTLERVKADGTFATGTEPRPGAIVIWAHGKGPAGHAGIVISIDANTMLVSEGNTNASGSREGDRSAFKYRTVSREFKPGGLNIAGYIYPFEV